MCKDSLKEILLEDILGTRRLEKSDRHLLTKATLPFNTEKENEILRQISMSLCLAKYGTMSVQHWPIRMTRHPQNTIL